MLRLRLTPVWGVPVGYFSCKRTFSSALGTFSDNRHPTTDNRFRLRHPIGTVYNQAMTDSITNGKTNPYRQLPSVDKLLKTERVLALVEDSNFPTAFVTEVARERLTLARQSIQQGQNPASLENLAEEVEREVLALTTGNLREVINAAGVIIHTNLGRAPLSLEATRAVEQIAKGYSNLEFELESGGRGQRLTHVSDLIARISGAEAGIAVNNNAAAVFMILAAFAPNKEVIVSRGQAVEIGGAFRIPDVITQGGGKLVEVGTTNKTYQSDYEDAITPNTAMLLRVHSSNFKVIGFTHTTSLEEMAEVAEKHNLILADDLGSGTFIDTARYGLAHEPTVQESITAGAQLVTFSGDKLLGGPQAGLIAGKKELIAKLKKHPLARALRLDKMTLAALQVTLLHYLRGEAERKIPVWQIISLALSQIEQRAESWQQALSESWPGASTSEGTSTIGGGSLPGETLPTRLLSLPPLPERSPDALMAALRHNSPPIIGRVERDRLLFDPRTVLPRQDEALLDGLRALVK